MPGCKDCRGGGLNSPSRVDDALKLYNPGLRGLAVGASLDSTRCKKTTTSGRTSMSKCTEVCNMPGRSSESDTKSYYSRNAETPLLRRYEQQPWFQNRIVQNEWKGFVDQLVTPKNIGSKLFPGPDDWEFKCHKARALVGPIVPCVWDLPEQEKCATSQYGVNRDWRRYNEDQRMESSDLNCECDNEPKCNTKGKKQTPCEWPTYLGKKYGSRYMAWSNPTSTMYPRARAFNFQSQPKCFV